MEEEMSKNAPIDAKLYPDREKRKIINGELYIYSEKTDKYYKKYKLSEGVGFPMELDEKYFVYVLEGYTLDETLDGGGYSEDEIPW